MPAQCRSPVATTMSSSVVPGESWSCRIGLTGTLRVGLRSTRANNGRSGGAIGGWSGPAGFFSGHGGPLSRSAASSAGSVNGSLQV